YAAKLLAPDGPLAGRALPRGQRVRRRTDYSDLESRQWQRHPDRGPGTGHSTLRQQDGVLAGREAPGRVPAPHTKPIATLRVGNGFTALVILIAPVHSGFGVGLRTKWEAAGGGYG